MKAPTYIIQYDSTLFRQTDQIGRKYGLPKNLSFNNKSAVAATYELLGEQND